MTVTTSTTVKINLKMLKCKGKKMAWNVRNGNWPDVATNQRRKMKKWNTVNGMSTSEEPWSTSE